MRDHMMGFVQSLDDGPVKPYPLGLPVRGTPESRAFQRKWAAERRASRAIEDFEEGDHMLPGMKQSDFPKEYDTRVAIEDRSMSAYIRSMSAYIRAMPEMLIYGTGRVKVDYDAVAPGGDMSAVARIRQNDALLDEWCRAPKHWQFSPEPPKTATGLRLLQEQAETWRRRAMSEMRPKPLNKPYWP